MDKFSSRLIKYFKNQTFSKYFINRDDVEIFLIGGSIRDFLLNKNEKDWDFLVSSEDASEFIHTLSIVGHLEKNPYGNYRWFHNSGYCDIIMMNNFNVGFGIPKNIYEFIGQVDISINSMVVSLNTGQFFDPNGGLKDLKNKVIRAMRFDHPDNYSALIDNKMNVKEVLWFRYMYFLLKLGFTPCKNTSEFIGQYSYYINKLHIFREMFFDPFLCK